MSKALLSLDTGAHYLENADIRIDPTPYERRLALLDVSVTNGPVRVTVDDDRLCIVGDKDCLGTIASFFDFEDSASSGEHSHCEWYEGSEIIDRESIPLVVSVAIGEDGG